MTTLAITTLGVDATQLAAIGATLKRYGLDPVGAPWAATADEVAQVAWRPLADALVARRPALWLIVADADALAAPHVRYALSLMARTLRAELGARLPVAVLGAGAGDLPPVLADAQLLAPDASWPAKLVAAVHRPRVADTADRLAVHGNEQLGQWLELAPAQGTWPGLVFGVAGADASIDFQAVGPSGGLPERSVLAHAQQGLQLDAGTRRFTAWALRNPVGQTDAGPVSYYVRVRGCPEALLWMPYTETDDGDATVLALV